MKRLPAGMFAAGTLDVVSRWLLLGVLVLALSCSTFGASDTAENPDAGPVVAPDGGDGGVTEASTDPRFCDRVAADAGRAPIYCRDFDAVGENALFDWSETDLSGDAGSLALDTTETVTPPAALRLRLEKTAPLCAYARASKVLGTTPQHFRVSFDVRRGGQDTVAPNSASYMVIGFAKGTASCLLILSGSDTGGNVHEQSPKGDTLHQLSRFPLDRQWTHMDVDVDRGTRALEVHVDGVSAFASPETVDPVCIATGDQLFINPGFHCEDSNGVPKETRLDDIVVTAPP